MRYGYVYPGGEARDAAEHARAAEDAGWDGFFVWDPVWGVDAWVTLAAAAMCTERIRLGTMITPVSRRRPWTLAGQAATLDRLSGGRAILAVGLGAIDTGFVQFGEVTERKTRAELLDEGLEIITGLWRGQPFNFDGAHYHVKETTFMPPPPPLQAPRIPIWVVGAWPRPKSMARVARYDGWLPAVMKTNGAFGKVRPDDVRAGRDYIEAHRTQHAPFDIVVEGDTARERPSRARAKIAAFAEAGVTWWLEAQWPLAETMFAPETQARIGARIRQGPPQAP
jgi:alkanesulfonate monooxygenase SsuD/methylene tetrahydromethanopterin reductase-like flavin-dependent oxidoreductase (luciferase family)